MKRLCTLLFLAVAVFAAAILSPSPVQARVSGDQVWQREFSGFPSGFLGLAPAPGGFYLVGTRATATGDRLWIARFASSGKVRWSRVTHAGVASCLAVTPKGALVVGGFDRVKAHGSDVVVVKYTATGGHIWTTTFDGRGQGNDLANAVAVDASGDVLVCGSTDTSGSRGVDALMLKLSGTTGARIWRFAYDGKFGPRTDVFNDCTVNASGSTFATGYVTDRSAGIHMLTAKVAASGKMRWSTTMTLEGWATGSKIAFVPMNGGSNACVVAGSTGDASSSDFYVARLNGTSGVPAWAPQTQDFGGSDSLQDMTMGLAGHTYWDDVFCVGQSATGSTDSSAVVAAWNLDGTPLFHAQLPHAAGEWDAFLAVTPSTDGIYAAGLDRTSSDRLIVSKYSWDGAAFTYRWTHQGASGNDPTYGQAVLWLAGGPDTRGVYVCGQYTPGTSTKGLLERIVP